MASNASGAQTGSSVSRGGFATGWTIFASVLMVFGGTMAIFQGISAIAKDDLIVVTRRYAYQLNTAGWGWIHLVLGVLIAGAGVALYGGALWARIVGIAVTGLGMIANFLWLPYYPFWAIVLIAIDIFVIWALSVGTTRRTGD